MRPLQGGQRDVEVCVPERQGEQRGLLRGGVDAREPGGVAGGGAAGGVRAGDTGQAPVGTVSW